MTASAPTQFAVMVVAQASPLRVKARGETGIGVLATAAPGAAFAVKQRVFVAIVGTETFVLAAGAAPASTGPAASGVYVPGDDGSVWQVKATSSGTLYTVKVS